MSEAQFETGSNLAPEHVPDVVERHDVVMRAAMRVLGEPGVDDYDQFI